MEELNKDVGLLDDEDDESSNSYRNNNQMTSSFNSNSSKVNNPFISSNKSKSPVFSTISLQRPRSSGQQTKIRGLDSYIETYKSSPKNISSLSNDNRIKINLPIEDLSIKNENIYKALDDHSFMTGDDAESTYAIGINRQSRTSSRRQSINDEDNDDDDDGTINDISQKNLKYKYTASYKIDEQTGAFKENSKISFEKNEQSSQQKQKKAPPPPIPPPPKSKSVISDANEKFEVKTDDNSKFFSDFLSMSDNLITKTQMKLEELNKKATQAVPTSQLNNTQNQYNHPQINEPQKSQIINNQTSSIFNCNKTQNVGLTTPLPPPNSKSLIDLNAFDEQTFDMTNQQHQAMVTQTETQIDKLFDINNNDFFLNTEPLTQRDSYYDLIGLTKSNSQYNVQASPQQTSYNISNELMLLESAHSDSVNASAPLYNSPYVDNYLDSIINSNTLTFFTSPPIDLTDSPNSSFRKEPSMNLLSSITEDLFITETVDTSISNFENNNIDCQIFAPEIQITEPLNEQNDDNIVPEDLFNLRNEVPYNQSRPVTPATPIPSAASVDQLSKDPTNFLSDIEAFLNSNSSILNENLTQSKLNDNIEPAKKEEHVHSKTRFTGKGYRGPSRIKKYVRKDGVMSNDDESSSEDDSENSQFKIRIRPKTLSQTSLNDEEKQNTGFQLLSKPPKTSEEIQNLQLLRRKSQESLTLTSKLEIQSSDEEVKAENNIEVTPVVADRKRKQSEVSEISIEMPDEDDNRPLEEFLSKDLCLKEKEEGWILMIRYPLRKPQLIYKNALQKITEIRAWTETVVKIVDDSKKLKLFYPHDLENPFHEIELKSAFKFTDLTLQQFDTYTKIHTFKIQEIVFKEMIQMRPDRLFSLPERFLKHFTKPKVTSLLDHTPIPFEVIKFAHMNHRYLANFVTVLQEDFWKLPLMTKKQQKELQKQKQQSSNTQNTLQSMLPAALTESKHAHEEITVKVIDEYKCKLDKKCRILEHKCRTRIFLVSFLNVDEPIIDIGLNDCLRHGKEIVGRHDIIPIKTETWISPEIFEINESIVDKDEFEKTHSLKCIDVPDNQIVEILRYRTRPRRNYELPLNVSCTMTVVKRKIEIKIECMIAGGYFTKLNEVFCENIQIRFPLPDAWVYLFRVEKRFRYGALHSTKSKFGKFKGFDRFLSLKSSTSSSANSNSSTSTTSNTKMEASCGHGKYEQAFKSIVWRIDQLPLKNKDVYKTQLFLCRINLQDYDNLPESYEPCAYVQYSMPTCAASKSQVRSISVNSASDEPPNKWVKLKTKFDYEIDISYVLDKDNDDLPTLNTENCDELKHIPSESEVENEEDNENDDENETLENLDKIKQQPSEAVLIDLL